MNILGIFAEGPNPAACMLIDGKMVGFCEEERFVREKSAMGHYPTNATRFCLEQAGLRISDIDRLAFGWDATKYASNETGLSFMQAFYGSLGQYYKKDPITLASEARITARFRPADIQSKVKRMLLEIDGNSEHLAPLCFVEHHLAHAASAYYCSGFDSAAIITIDGSGEEICAALWKGAGNSIKHLQKIRIPHSLGWFYAAFVEYLGLRPYRDEGKLMALAAYGRANAEIEAVVEKVCQSSDEQGYLVNPYYTFYGGHQWGQRFTDRLVEELGPPRQVKDSPTQDEADIAYAVQAKLESVIQKLVRSWVSSTGLRNLCLAGGVALNCKMNGALLACQKDGIFDKMFIQPVSSDAGTALGAGLVIAAQAGFDTRFEMTHVYWGPEYSDCAIRNSFRLFGMEPLRGPVAQIAAKLLAHGAIVGWFQGRSEVGPRALGNRSVLANPQLKESPDLVNQKLKRREYWRPFGPALLADVTSEFLDDGCWAPFMVRSFRVRKDVCGKIPAVVHQDGSTRPQTVRKNENPRFHELICAFENLTGVPVVLNTSFNGPGEPIVCSPEDAIKRYNESGLDALIVGDYLSIKSAWHGWRPQQ